MRHRRAGREALSRREGGRQDDRDRRGQCLHQLPHAVAAALQSMICVRDPRDDVDSSRRYGLTNITGLVARERSSKQLPVYRRLRGRAPGQESRAARPQSDRRTRPTRRSRTSLRCVEAFRVAIEPVGCPASGYQFDLNMPAGSPFEALSFSYPRLAPTKDQDGADVINVPLFSDLKRHDMGEGLADKFDQGTDVATISVTAPRVPHAPLVGRRRHGPVAARWPGSHPPRRDPLARVARQRSQPRDRRPSELELRRPGGDRGVPAQPAAADRLPLSTVFR